MKKEILEDVRSRLSRIEDYLEKIDSKLDSIESIESDQVLVVREADFNKLKSYASELIGKLHP